nr:tudor and KH domain-containing protein homolog isoform X1 [Halyomorpha halys]
MAWMVKSLIAFVALPILSICAATIYYYHICDKEWEEYIKNIRRKEVDVKIPLSCIGSLIGRAGTNIKELQDRTKTKIFFRNIEGEQNFKICRIVGEKENVEEAKNLIIEFIDPKDSEALEMWVPQSAIGLIIGRCGDNIRKISQTTNTKITVDRYKVAESNKKLVVIKGKSLNVAAAKELIENKIQEDEKKRKELVDSSQTRSPRMKAKNHKENEVGVKKESHYERLITESSDSMIQVYVSSVASPSHLWLQLITPRSVDLDHLVDDMTEYYSKEENRIMHKLKEVKTGQIVASRFEHDKKWYRVEVFSVEINETNPDENKVDVFYVDYGDSAYYPLKELYELKPDFLDLKFQAIEVSMAGIESKNGGEDWDEASVDAFEDMVYPAQWKAMLVQVVGYKETTLATHPGLVPCIRLYDPDGRPGIDIGKRLIEEGFALAVGTEEPPASVDDDDDDDDD